jgi:AcrR family transcriptional regulator
VKGDEVSKDINIEKRLIESAIKLFTDRGYKKTKVSDITKEADVGTGTFYNYFNTKDDIFLEIYLMRHDEMKKEMTKLISEDGEAINIIENVLRSFLKRMKEDPILRMFLNKDTHHKYRKGYDSKRKKDKFEYAYELFQPYFKKWQETGQINPEVDLRILLTSFDSIFYVELYKEDIGKEYFPEVIDFIIEGILLKLKM